MIRRHETAAVAARDMKAGVVPYPTAGGGIEGQFEVAGCASRVEAEVHGSHEKTDKKGMERPDGTQGQFTSAGVMPTGTGRSRGTSVAMSFRGGPGSHVTDTTPIWHPRRLGTHGDRHTARNTHQHGDIAAEAGLATARRTSSPDSSGLQCRRHGRHARPPGHLRWPLAFDPSSQARAVEGCGPTRSRLNSFLQFSNPKGSTGMQGGQTILNSAKGRGRETAAAYLGDPPDPTPLITS